MIAPAADNRHELLRIQALLDRLEASHSPECDVPGCVHVEHGSEEPVELRPAA
jgi:hypothetical protein